MQLYVAGSCSFRQQILGCMSWAGVMSPEPRDLPPERCARQIVSLFCTSLAPCGLPRQIVRSWALPLQHIIYF